MRQGLAAFWATGAELGRPYLLALLAEACGKAGQPDEGLTVMARRYPEWTKLESVSTKPSCIGYVASLRSPSLVSRV